MDQGPKDQNSETRNLSPADEGDNHDNVNLMDMELEPQLEDEIPSAADLLAGAFNISYPTYEADLEISRKSTQPAEMDTLHSKTMWSKMASSKRRIPHGGNEFRNPASNW